MSSQKKIEIHQSSFLSLKAELFKKREEVRDAKLSECPNKPTPVKKLKTKLDEVNKGVDERNSRDLEQIEEESNVLLKSKRALEAKSKLYDELSKNPESAADVSNILVDFSNKERENEEAGTAADEAGTTAYEAGTGAEEADIAAYEAGTAADEAGEETRAEGHVAEQEWVDFVDCLGRTKRCHKDDLDAMKINDDNLKLSLFGDSSASGRRDYDPRREEKEVPGQPDLCSDDMRRKVLREKWEKEERQLADRRDIHYQHVLFDEARTHGVGYFPFSTDEDVRAQQLQSLADLRKGTVQEQMRTKLALRERHQKVEERMRIARMRKNERLGLPTDMETGGMEEEEEEPPKPEQLKRDAKTPLVTRVWDIGKKSSKRTYTQNEWILMKRSERRWEFAPPRPRGSSRSGRKRKRSQTFYPAPYPGRTSAQEFTPTQSHERTGPSMKRNRGQRYQPDPFLEDMSSPWELRTPYERERGARAEIPPPSATETRGTSSGERARFTITPEMEKSIEEGLNIIRKQVEEQKKRDGGSSSDAH